MKNSAFIPALRYHIFTPFYDSVIKTVVPERQVKLKTVELAELEPSEKVLDFGCGTGTLLNLLPLKKLRVEAIGIDVDARMLSVARKKLASSKQEANLVLYEGGELPFPDNYFDKVLSTWVFHHLTDEQKKVALNQIYRKLKPGGKLIITDWGKSTNWLMRALFFCVQVIDNFKTTAANVEGRLPEFIGNIGFTAVTIVKNQSTALGTLSYYTARKLR